MKRINILVMVCIWLMSMATQCSRYDCHNQINFVNNSAKDVYIEISGISHHYHDLDTTQFYLMFSNPYNYNPPDYFRIKSGEKGKVEIRRKNCLEGWIAQGRVFVYVFDAEVLATVPWEVVGKDYLVLKTYHINLEEMESSNWTITYTGE